MVAANGGVGAPPDWYGVLGVAADADARTIKKRYYQLSLKHHPDTTAHSASADAAATTFVQLTQAYAVLGDTAKRRAYDAERAHMAARAAHRAAAGAAGAAGAARRTTQWGEEVQRVYDTQFVYDRSNVGEVRPRYRNTRVMLVVCLLGVAGATVQWMRAQWATDTVLSMYDQRDMYTTSLLASTKEVAQSNGYKKQLDILIDKHRNTPPPYSSSAQ